MIPQIIGYYILNCLKENLINLNKVLLLLVIVINYRGLAWFILVTDRTVQK